jgi:hypothetical protein
VWAGLAADLGRAAIADRLVMRFQVDGATARRDVDAFFDALESAGLATAAETDRAR